MIAIHSSSVERGSRTTSQQIRDTLVAEARTRTTLIPQVPSGTRGNWPLPTLTLRDRANHILFLLATRCNICTLAFEENFRKYGLYHSGGGVVASNNPPQDPGGFFGQGGPDRDQEEPCSAAASCKGKAVMTEDSSSEFSSEDEGPLGGTPWVDHHEEIDDTAFRLKDLMRQRSSSLSGGRAQSKELYEARVAKESTLRASADQLGQTSDDVQVGQDREANQHFCGDTCRPAFGGDPFRPGFHVAGH
uniref:Uncharacterized protein n=1 Tax=Cannabis sativa TaxID=3483 RepID=A0A803NMQ5_CANSA